jgi:hypothetical protein
LLGLYRREVLYVAYTERGDNIRIISARRAERHEQDRYYRQNAPRRDISSGDAGRHRDPRVRSWPARPENRGGNFGSGAPRSIRAVDNRRRISSRAQGAPHQDVAAGPRADAEEFAARYHIPFGTVRDWEQGRSEPDQPARANLTVIARDPEGVRRALEAKPGC